MTFTFRFQTLLKQRQREEDHRQRDLAKLLRQQMILQTQLRDMQETISGSKQNMAEALVGRVDLDQVAGFTRYSAQVQQRGMAIVVRLASLQKQIVAAREHLIEASQGRKALELLHDRQFAQWQHEQRRMETRRLDELATQHYVRTAMAEVKR
jgi:flagellar protein FliJ